MGEAKRRRGGESTPPPGDLLQALIEIGEGHARKVLLERREPSLQPCYHLIAADGRHAIVPCQWENNLQKDLMVAAVKQIAADIDAVAALFFTEGWVVKASFKGQTAWHRWRAEERITAIPPSENPDRREVIWLWATDGERTLTRMLQMVRDRPGGRLIALVPDADGAPREQKGRMITDILPRH